MLTIRQIPDRLRALGSAALTAGLVFAAGAATAGPIGATRRAKQGIGPSPLSVV